MDILRKGTVAAEFQEISRNYVETMPFHKIFTSANKVKLWYFMQCLWFTWCCLMIRYILILMLIYLPFHASFPDEIIYFCCHNLLKRFLIKQSGWHIWTLFLIVKTLFVGLRHHRSRNIKLGFFVGIHFWTFWNGFCFITVNWHYTQIMNK